MSVGFAMNLVAQGFTCANSRSFWSIADSEGPDVPEGSTPDTRANRLDLAIPLLHLRWHVPPAS